MQQITRKRGARPEKGCRNNNSIIEIWKQFCNHGDR